MRIFLLSADEVETREKDRLGEACVLPVELSRESFDLLNPVSHINKYLHMIFKGVRKHLLSSS